jgi:hypothetical protein
LTGRKVLKGWEDVIVKSDSERAPNVLGCPSEMQKILQKCLPCFLITLYKIHVLRACLQLAGHQWLTPVILATWETYINIIYIYTYINIIYTHNLHKHYIYIQRERERERERDWVLLCSPVWPASGYQILGS